MKWVTREDAKVDRIACPWLIRKFVDPDAEFLFAPADEVMSVARREGAIPYDVPGVELGHVDGRCSFESILHGYGLGNDPALVELAKIVHAADVEADIDSSLEGRGLQAIAKGFPSSMGKTTTGRSRWRVRCMTLFTHFAWRGQNARPLDGC